MKTILALAVGALLLTAPAHGQTEPTEITVEALTQMALDACMKIDKLESADVAPMMEVARRYNKLARTNPNETHVRNIDVVYAISDSLDDFRQYNWRFEYIVMYKHDTKKQLEISCNAGTVRYFGGAVRKSLDY